MSTSKAKIITDASRIASLEQHGLLDTLPEPEFDRLTKLATYLLGKPVSLLSLVDKDRQFFKSAQGLPSPWAELRQTPLSHSFCQHVVASDQPLVVNDARSHSLVSNNLAVRDLNVIAYLGVPVHGTDGETHGALCAVGSEPYEWTDRDVDVMSELAAIVETEFLLREKLKQAEVLAREYHHRVKNSLAVAASLVAISGKEAKSVKEVVDAAKGRLMSLAEAQSFLLFGNEVMELEELVASLLKPYKDRTTVQVNGPSVSLDESQITPLCFFVHELATNSAKHGAFSGPGAVNLTWKVAADRSVRLCWDEKSDKISVNANTGFGSQLFEIATQQLSGTMQNEFEDGRLQVTLEFPAQTNLKS